MDAAGATPEPVPAGSAEEIRPGVWVCSDAAAVAREAAGRIVAIQRSFLQTHEAFHVAISGGRTPLELFRLLATDEFRNQFDWPRVQVFWADERPVELTHPDSNFGTALRELFTHVPLPAENLHRMPAEWPHIGRTAQVYEELLRKILPLDSRGFPRFDLILLGLGADGHTASLFPGPVNPAGTSRWVTTPMVEKLGTRRMTLTLPVLNAAHRILFLVTGAEKAEVLRAVLEGGQDPPLPAELVRPFDGEREFIVDAAAAARLG